jgi:hypothetical protein
MYKLKKKEKRKSTQTMQEAKANRYDLSLVD